MTTGETLRIFVAMPVKAMGADASWGDVKEIRSRLLAPAAVKIGQRLDRTVELVIEDEKKTSGHIPTSMFSEANDADIYIADLTGFSANVFLELGVRWAVKDRVTILIAQDTSNLKFNVAYNRAIEYGPMPTQLEKAVSDIADYAVAGLTQEVIDSPVRSGSRLVTLPKTEVDELRAEIATLRNRRGDDLIAVARRTTDIDERIGILAQAAAVNPVSFEARMMLGKDLREIAKYAMAEIEFKSAVRIAPGSADAWQELATTQSKMQSLKDAAESFRLSLEINSEQGETWRTLGGLRRRLARDTSGAIEDWQQIRSSRDAYEHSVQIEPENSYGLFNFWLLSLILALHDGTDTTNILGEFEILRRLCDYQVARNPHDPWKRLDLAATLAILEKEPEAAAETKSALDAAGSSRQMSYIDSAIPPLRDLLSVLDAGTARYSAIAMMIESLSHAHSRTTI